MTALAQIDPVRVPAARKGASSRSSARSLIMLGLLVIGITFLGFGTWSAFAPIASGAHAPGVVIVETRRKTVQHLEGGIIQEILVRDGDWVEEGRSLIRLDPTQPQATYEILRGRMDEELALESRLIAERDELEAIKFPDSLALRERSEAVIRLMADQSAVFNARRNEIVSQIDILEQRIGQLAEQINGMKAEQVSNRKQTRLINEELTSIRSLAEKGYASLSRVRALERTAAELEGDYAARVSDMARTQVAIGETRLEILQAKQTFRRGVLDELNAVRARIAEIAQQLNRARDVLARTEIRAPTSGYVVGMNIHTVGGVISPGTPILDLVPAGDKLIIEAQVRTIDIDRIYPGLEADVRFSGLPHRSTPLLKGAVRTVSADAITNAETGMSHYNIQVEIPDDELKKLVGVTLRPGMPAEVLVNTGERTALDYFISPWSQLFESALRER